MANAFAVAAEKARAANEERYSQGMSLWDEIIQRYQPGGAFGAGAMASYERGKTKAVGAGMQQLVSAGLANTTVAATIGKKYEEEVGTPFRTQLEDMRMGRLSQAQEGKVGFIERREDVAPDPNVAMQSGMQAGYGRGGGGGGGDNFTMPGFNEGWMSSSSPFGGGGSRGGASSSSGTATNPGGTRAGTPEYQRTLDIGRITFAGEESRTGEFSPTGTGGEAKSLEERAATMTAADFAKMGARNPEQQALYEAWGGRMRAAGMSGWWSKTGGSPPSKKPSTTTKKSTSYFPSSGIGWSSK